MTLAILTKSSLLQIHIVDFDSQSKISQIRLYWDQGSLLKQLEVIGSRGRNWPIRDAADQIRLITSSAADAAKKSIPGARPTHISQPAVDESAAAAWKESPSKKHLKDPHATLSLFGPQSQPEDHAAPTAVASRLSAKPPPRDYSELFVAGNESDSTPTKAPTSPKKNDATDRAPPPRGAAGHNYKPSRLFGEGEEMEESEHRHKSNPKKYNHFEFGEAAFEEEKTIPTRPRSSKHMSQWDFEDFVTPEKPRQRIRGQDVRHFGWSDDEVDQAETPPKHPRAVQPRRDAETHFELQDDGTPVAQTKGAGRAKGAAQNDGLGLYENNLYNESGNIEPTPELRGLRRTKGVAHNEGLRLYQNNLYSESGMPDPTPEPKSVLGTVPNGVSRKKDFDSHWTMSDPSPDSDNKTDENKRISTDRMKAVKMMDSSWDTYDESLDGGPTAPPPGKRISRNPNQRSWALGDDDL
jgi:hypothetical protein